MISEIILVPEKETEVTYQRKLSRPFLLKKAIILDLPPEKLLPPPLKEFPISKWNMPPEPEGYIKGNDNDCL